MAKREGPNCVDWRGLGKPAKKGYQTASVRGKIKKENVGSKKRQPFGKKLRMGGNCTFKGERVVFVKRKNGGQWKTSGGKLISRDRRRRAIGKRGHFKEGGRQTAERRGGGEKRGHSPSALAA